ncbi:ribosome biogenesis protein Nop53/GLTSCR2 [Pseudoneurospora amorphoporcata]|uniref:Ribosome biogenesis protein NOP53 n=1 Tax=Pseudoneurospora amorphoporcata TaxID=241081 RepID=A0AAN6NS33_9PEZI|nr:ribosome biogenesis protein Nop53/GLTSCR2 [Pseudoneurospora amorphoporcata]
MPVLKPLSGDGQAPKQFKQPSRKGKKAWRKNVDVTEVEQGLDELNAQIIKGGVIAEKKSEELFAIDVKPDTEITKKLPKQFKKPLKADEILAQRSAVPAVSLKKRPASETSGKVTDGVLPSKRLRATYVTHKELTRLKRVADGHHTTTVEVVDATFDAWADPEEDKKKQMEESLYNFLPKVDKAKAPKTLAQQPISLAATGKQLPAVPKPKGDKSYNPAFTDYSERYQSELRKAEEAERKRLEELEKERLKAEAAAKSRAEAEAAEKRAELSEWEDDSAWEGAESDADGLSSKKKRPERKTQAQRNKIKRRKAEEQRLKHEAAIKKKEAEVARVKHIAKELELAEKERQLALQKAEKAANNNPGDDTASLEEEDDDDVELRRRQLGKFKLPEKDLELVLPDELQDSLRLLKPEGNLLKDRYRNLLLRGKVEARRHNPYKKQAKKQITEKWTFKDFTLQ